MLAVLTSDGLIPARKDSDELLFIKGWFLIGFFLLYVPTDFQVHMLNSWQIPVPIPTATALFKYIIPMIAE